MATRIECIASHWSSCSTRSCPRLMFVGSISGTTAALMPATLAAVLPASTWPGLMALIAAVASVGGTKASRFCLWALSFEKISVSRGSYVPNRQLLSLSLPRLTTGNGLSTVPASAARRRLPPPAASPSARRADGPRTATPAAARRIQFRTNMSHDTCETSSSAHLSQFVSKWLREVFMEACHTVTTIV